MTTPFALVPTTALERLVEAKVLTTDPNHRDSCCGLPRLEDGRCQLSLEHPVYLEVFLIKVREDVE